jgi:hypothetical protein
LPGKLLEKYTTAAISKGKATISNIFNFSGIATTWVLADSVKQVVLQPKSTLLLDGIE